MITFVFKAAIIVSNALLNQVHFICQNIKPFSCQSFLWESKSVNMHLLKKKRRKSDDSKAQRLLFN